LRVEAEGHDRRNLDLPGAQEQLLEAVYAANPKMVLVLENAGPLAVAWAQDHVPAILEAWYPGEDAGDTIAQTLLGLNNPSGHLPYTVYQSLDGVPPQNEYDVSKGFTYMYFKGIPLYAFGHGLSYTRFEYSHLKVSQSGTGSQAKFTVSFDLKNTGEREGAEVVQLYTHQRASAVYQPIRSLRFFERVNLKAGETKPIVLDVPLHHLAFYDVKMHGFKIEPGVFDVLVGSASDDIRLRGILEVSPSMTAVQRKPVQNIRGK
jgi:beta-glucosidase